MKRLTEGQQRNVDYWLGQLQGIDSYYKLEQAAHQHSLSPAEYAYAAKKAFGQPRMGMKELLRQYESAEPCLHPQESVKVEEREANPSWRPSSVDRSIKIEVCSRCGAWRRTHQIQESWTFQPLVSKDGDDRQSV